MENPQGRVVSLVDGAAGSRAIVAVEVAAACPRCAAGKGCGAGLFAGGGAVRQIEAAVPDGIRVAADDVVEVSLAPASVLRAAVVVYGMPMIGAVGAAAVAYGLSLGDAGAAVAALMGLAGGFGVGRWRLRQSDCRARFVPSIERRIGAGHGKAP